MGVSQNAGKPQNTGQQNLCALKPNISNGLGLGTTAFFSASGRAAFAAHSTAQHARNHSSTRLNRD